MLIINGRIITWEADNQILDGQAIYIQDGSIVSIAPQAELRQRFPDEQVLDAGGQYVMPGNICAHTHFYGAFARGMSIPGAAPRDFPEILHKLWWPLDLALDAEAVRYSALVCLVEAIRHGTTTLVDHHASPNLIDGSLDILAEAVEQSGLRAVLCYEVTDRNDQQGAQAGIAENVRFIKKLSPARNNPKSRVGATFGLHASLTLSEATLEAAAAAAPEGSGFHIHVAEHEVDEQDSLAKSSMRVVERLHRHGLLGPRSIAVHGVHVNEAEIELLAKTGTWVSHQPRSNMNNGVGLPKVEAMLQAGVRVCLGNDGFSNAMWEEWKAAYLAHKLWHRDPRRMSGGDILRMGVYNNAALANTFFPAARLGSLVPGAQADLIFVDYHPFTELTPANLPWHILFGFHESMVTTTMVGGRVLMQDRRLVGLDEAAIAARARELAQQVWGRYAQSFEANARSSHS